MIDGNAVTRALVAAAYEQGWRDACYDWRKHRHDPSWPLGQTKRHDADRVLAELDPKNLLDLRADKA